MIRFRKNEGITILTLVITIILILIIAGVVMSNSFRGGVVDEATNTRKETQEFVNKTSEDEQNVFDFLVGKPNSSDSSYSDSSDSSYSSSYSDSSDSSYSSSTYSDSPSSSENGSEPVASTKMTYVCGDYHGKYWSVTIDTNNGSCQFNIEQAGNYHEGDQITTIYDWDEEIIKKVEESQNPLEIDSLSFEDTYYGIDCLGEECSISFSENKMMQTFNVPSSQIVSVENIIYIDNRLTVVFAQDRSYFTVDGYTFEFDE